MSVQSGWIILSKWFDLICVNLVKGPTNTSHKKQAAIRMRKLRKACYFQNGVGVSALFFQLF